MYVSTFVGPSNSQVNFNPESGKENSASTEDDTKGIMLILCKFT